MWESEGEIRGGGGGGRDHGIYSADPDGRDHGIETDGFERRDQSWYVASDIPSDLLVQVGDISFHLHKYPLLSRSAGMNRMIYELSSRDPEPNVVKLDDIPGGAESFELASKFCYGIAVDLTPSNISGLRCAAEYLEMTEDLEEGNLIFKTEAFLSYVVLSSWRDSIVVLKSCEGLSPWAENLQIVRRCSESIAWKACANPRGIRWAYTGRSSCSSKESSPSKKQSQTQNGQHMIPPDWWFEDVSILRIDHFVRVITAIKVKGMRLELLGAAIVHYASKWLPGLASEQRNSEELRSSQAREQRMVIESLISIVPPHKDCVSCSFLLRLLRVANMLKVAPALVTELEKRVGMQLEQAGLPDLMIPSYSKSETMYDVDLVQRLVEHFLVQEPVDGASSSPGGDGGAGGNAKVRVARILDSYLTEVSRDRNLSLTKFQVLAETLPESTRTCDDGLYRAVDSYLKAHPTLTEHERKRLCRVMDCQKLSIDACMHAAQNERLPLRVVVQVLFSEQVKITNAIASSSHKEAAGDPHYQPILSTRRQLLEGTPQSFQEGWAAAKKDINTLKFDLGSVKAKHLELQNDMEALQRQFEKMAPVKPEKQASSAWSNRWKKLSKLGSGKAGMQGGEMTTTAMAEQARKGTRRWRNSIS